VPGGFPLYTYWALVFYLAVIIGVFIVVASDSTQTYHVALVGYLGCGLVLSTSAVNGLIHTSQGAKEAAAAGFILLSMVTVRPPYFWITGRLFANLLPRLCGYSISVPHRQPSLVPTSTRLPSPRSQPRRTGKP
jgi:hypothetical protein